MGDFLGSYYSYNISDEQESSIGNSRDMARMALEQPVSIVDMSEVERTRRNKSTTHIRLLQLDQLEGMGLDIECQEDGSDDFDIPIESMSRFLLDTNQVNEDSDEHELNSLATVPLTLVLKQGVNHIDIGKNGNEELITSPVSSAASNNSIWSTCQPNDKRDIVDEKEDGGEDGHVSKKENNVKEEKKCRGYKFINIAFKGRSLTKLFAKQQ